MLASNTSPKTGEVLLRVIAKRPMVLIWQKPGQADAEGPLESWNEQVSRAAWSSPQDEKIAI